MPHRHTLIAASRLKPRAAAGKQDVGVSHDSGATTARSNGEFVCFEIETIQMRGDNPVDRAPIRQIRVSRSFPREDPSAA
jgi:hypothetical protein